MNWSRAKLFDFTGTMGEGETFSRFGDDVMNLLRQPTEEKLAIVLDTGFGWTETIPCVVHDHINLSGLNPLIGPNHAAGTRFPVVQGIYQDDAAKELGNLKTIIIAGLRHGRLLPPDDADFMHILGADCYTYNTVPTMLVAAHAGWKVLAVVGPDNHSWQKECVTKIRQLAAVAK